VTSSWCGELLSSTEVRYAKGPANCDAAAFIDFFPAGPDAALARFVQTRARAGMVSNTYVPRGFNMAELFRGPLYTEPLEVKFDKIY